MNIGLATLAFITSFLVTNERIPTSVKTESIAETPTGDETEAKETETE